MRSFVFEEHHAVLAHWFEHGYRHRTVICFDAHLDLQRIGDERIARLKRCQGADQVRALAKAHHLLPDGVSSYSIEDFFYAARRLGIIRHLVWVVPSFVEIENPIEAVEQLRELDGVTPDCVANAESELIDGQTIVRARLLGLQLTLCRFQSLRSLDLPTDSLVDIDIDCRKPRTGC